MAATRSAGGKAKGPEVAQAEDGATSCRRPLECTRDGRNLPNIELLGMCAKNRSLEEQREGKLAHALHQVAS